MEDRTSLVTQLLIVNYRANDVNSGEFSADAHELLLWSSLKASFQEFDRTFVGNSVFMFRELPEASQQPAALCFVLCFFL